MAAMVAALASFALWWSDGAWINGAMPTNGLITVASLAGGGILCLLAAVWIDRLETRDVPARDSTTRRRR